MADSRLTRWLCIWDRIIWSSLYVMQQGLTVPGTALGWGWKDEVPMEAEERERASTEVCEGRRCGTFGGPWWILEYAAFQSLCWDVRGWESCSHINFRRWGSQRDLRDCHIQPSILQTRKMHSEIGPRSFHLWVWWLLKKTGETWMKWKGMMWQLFWKSNTWRYCTC